MLDSVATVTDDTIMAAALPDGGTLASEKTTKAFFASIQVYASTESLSVLLLGGINLTAIAASKSSKLLNSWAPRQSLYHICNTLSKCRLCGNRLYISQKHTQHIVSHHRLPSAANARECAIEIKEGNCLRAAHNCAPAALAGSASRLKSVAMPAAAPVNQSCIAPTTFETPSTCQTSTANAR